MGACEQNHEKETIPTGKFRARGIPKGKRYREVKKRAKKQTAHKLAVEIQHATFQTLESKKLLEAIELKKYYSL